MSVALVGREAELATVIAWLDDALGGAPRAVLLSGSPGIGKTSLLEAVLAKARARGVRTAVGRVSEQDGSPPFWPWRQVLAQVDGSDDLLAIAEGGDLPAERFARFEAVVAALTAAATSAAAGLVVALDDVHRADQGSLRLLEHLVGRLSQEPVLLLVAHRPDPADHAEGFGSTLASLARSPARRSVVLGGLDRASVAMLLAEPADADLVDRVLGLTDGNALFVSELAAHLEAGGSLDTLPQSLREVVDARLGSRSAACAGTIRLAAAGGRDVDVPVLAAALGQPVAVVLGHLDEAHGAGLLSLSATPGRYRFSHELLREAAELTVPAPERAAMHRRLAEAVLAHHGDHRDHLADIARHWEQASMLGDADVAAMWNERAARAADDALAWEEAARLFERAVALGGTSADPLTRHERLFGLARALLHSEEITRAIPRCLDAVDAAWEAGRVDLAAEAVLLVEGRGGSAGPEILDILRAAEQVFDALPPDSHALRARVLGLQAALAFYVDPARCEALGAEALAEAARADDPRATAAAARTRQMTRLGPDHAEERLVLADRIGEAGRAMGDPSTEIWGPLWRIEALLELGRLPEAVEAMPSLRRLAAAAGHPTARWHAVRTEAILAAATGRWSDAVRLGEQAADLLAAMEGRDAAVAQQIALVTPMGLNRGFPPDAVDAYLALPIDEAPSFLGDIPVLSPVPALAALGRIDEARSWYDRAVPVPRWQPPDFLRLAIVALRLYSAAGLGLLDDVEVLSGMLAPYRGRHVAGGGGAVSYFGPVTLLVGEANVVMSRWDDAIPDLRSGLDEARRAAVAPYEVRASVLLAEALWERDEPGDREEAARVAGDAKPGAEVLAMEPWLGRLARLDRLADGTAPVDDGRAGPLSPRELEVAGLVADGMTNRAIGAELFISERTAQNHVQHILTKLGLANRAQIASWYRSR